MQNSNIFLLCLGLFVVLAVGETAVGLLLFRWLKKKAYAMKNDIIEKPKQ
jgi:hypothetical protein